jgi:signal peptidase I
MVIGMTDPTAHGPDPAAPRSIDLSGADTIETARSALVDLGRRLPDEADANTVADWVALRLGRDPEIGDDLEAEGLVVDVLAVADRRATRVRFTRVDAPAAAPAPRPAPAATAAPTRPAKAKKPEDGSVKETIISMLIALAMALVAKVYVVEAFVIPTGSMAPTLLGQHMSFRSDLTGHEWAVNPWYYADINNALPRGVQGVGRDAPPVVTDPMTIGEVDRGAIEVDPRGSDRAGLATRTGYTPRPEPKRIRAGDRILVQKYLYEVFGPERYDVVVFKNPEDATMNFIKRLVGLPNEQIWLADGDVFARPIELDVIGEPTPTGDWSIQRKPDRVQKALWRPIFSSEFTPTSPVSETGRRVFSSPWTGAGWELDAGRVYRAAHTAPIELVWDTDAWPITDWEPYNDVRTSIAAIRDSFPIADLRMRAGVRPGAPDSLVATATVSGRGREFVAEFGPGSVVLKMRRGENGPWTELATGSWGSSWGDRITSVEFWHVDQSLSAWVDGEKVAEGSYDWGPVERMAAATVIGEEDVLKTRPKFWDERMYASVKPGARWSFSGGGVELTRVGLDRDIYYQPRARGRTGPAALGTHPDQLATLGPDQFFMLGDNSPSSKDGRLWDRVDPAIRQIDPTEGVVNRKLLLGKAFFVYWPAPRSLSVGGFSLPFIPDFGSMRFIK